MYVTTDLDPFTGAVFARNPYSTEFGERVAFFGVSESEHTVTGDRAEFLGRNGTVAAPAAMTRVRLSGRVGAGLDPCAAIQVTFELAANQEREIVFVLGVGHEADAARELVERCHGIAPAREALDAVWHYWSHTLGAVNVETPDPSVNVLANGWLLYQTLAARLWGRSGFYQSGGAFGFRDQLQDVMALIHAEPGIDPPTSPALRVAPIQGGRRSALVASAHEPRRPNALLGRLSVARAGHLPLCIEHRRHRGPG